VLQYLVEECGVVYNTASLADAFRTWGSTVVSLIESGAAMEVGVVLPLEFAFSGGSGLS
jgi:hypothetical protein